MYLYFKKDVPDTDFEAGYRISRYSDCGYRYPVSEKAEFSVGLALTGGPFLASCKYSPLGNILKNFSEYFQSNKRTNYSS